MGFLLHVFGITATSLFSMLGLNLVFGKGKILHFGPLAASLAAAYGTFLTVPHTENYLISFCIGLTLALLISALFAWLSLRLTPDGLGVMSIALHLAMLAIVLNSGSWTRGALGLPGIQRMTLLARQEHFVFAMVLLAGAWVLFLWLLDRGPFGRQIAALSEQEWYAAGLGVRRWRINLIAFLIAGLGGALTNVFYHQYIGLVHPNDFAFSYFIFMITVIVAGKPGSVLGVTLSTILLTLLREGLRLMPIPSGVLGPVRLILFGAILFAAVCVRRDTLFPPERKV